MKGSLLIEEKYYSHWPLIAAVSLALSCIVFILYLFADQPILEGLLRLTAFILFAAGVLSLLKVNQGKISVLTSFSEEDEILVSYSQKNRETETEIVPANSIAEIKIDEMPNRSLYNDIVKSDRSVRFRRIDNSDWEYLCKVDGRVIPFTEENAKRLYHFLKEQLGL